MKFLALFLGSLLGLGAIRAEGADSFYKIGPYSGRNDGFFRYNAASRAEMLDRVAFVHETDAFAPGNGALPLNEIFLAAARTNANKTVLAPLADGRYSSVRQVRAARAEGFKVCLGPARTINDVVLGVQLAPDQILLPKDVSIEKLRKALLEYKAQLLCGTPLMKGIDFADQEVRERHCNYDRAAPRAAGATLRVLTYNILADYWNHKPQIAPRAPIVAETILHLKPDVVGLQEAQKEWYLALEDKIAPYRFVTQKDPADQKVNPSCNILYDAARYRQLDGGIRPFLDRWIRCFHWALLEEKATGKRLIVANTHWSLTEAARIKSAKRMAGFIAELRVQYGVPIVCTGDYNATVKSPSFRTLIAESGFRDAMTTAPVTENHDLRSYYWPVLLTSPQKGLHEHIDHIVVSPDLTPLAARLIVSPRLTEASDHFPIVVDLK